MGFVRAESEVAIDSGTVRGDMPRPARTVAKRSHERALLLAAALVWVVLAAGRAQAGDATPPTTTGDALFDEEFVAPQVPDPLEPMNRPMFAGIELLDHVIIADDRWVSFKRQGLI